MTDLKKPDYMSSTFAVNSNMVGPGKLMKIPEILRQFQQVGMDHLEAANHGLEVLEQLHQAFLTSKNSIKIHRLPVYPEVVTVQTCTPRYEGLFNVRYYRMLDKNQNVLVDSYSYWTLVDTNTKKIIRPTHADHSYMPMNEAFTVSAQKPARITLPDKMEKVDRRTVMYSEIDQYGHMNNTRYVDTILDYVDTDSFNISDIDITYYKEMPLGKEFNVCKFRDDRTYVLAFSSDDESVSFAAKITIK